MRNSLCGEQALAPRRDVLRAMCVRLGQDEGKLFAPVSSDEIPRSRDARSEEFRDALQAIIPLNVPVVVVVKLEEVDVDHEKGQRLLVPACRAPLELEDRIEVPPVRDPRQPVFERQVMQLSLQIEELLFPSFFAR